ncbi:asparagine synthase (glutamine-hydrolyzing) [Alphaproteobacteria bacterium]|nr:asparagine synthase (glutamine-hydrolyzing) [Alphaproteobacteria bacterium]
MCGIAGFQGRFDAGLLPQMAARLAHRGPDYEGIYHDADHSVGLVHRRLAIQDLSPAGHQPMWNATLDVAIVFNGEIYNFLDLRQMMEQGGVIFRGHSDTEVLLQLYLVHGMDMLPMLNGIYAFALWDARKKKMFLARDGLGVKPLYFSEMREGLVFGSELKSLLVHPQVRRKLNPEAVVKHMTFLWCPAPETALEGVKKLDPGFALEVKHGKVSRLWRHYDLPTGQVAPFRGTTEDAVDAVQEALRVAVRRQLIADVPVGAFLSGGLDSSSIVALAQNENNQADMRCFTIGIQGVDEYRDGVISDLPYAKKVAEHLGVNLSTIWLQSNMIQRLEEMIWHLDEPQADPAPINALLICEQARSHGIKVLLSGAGGDDIFTGYRRHWALMQENKWSWMPETARRFIGNLAQNLPKNNPRLRRIAKGLRYMGEKPDRRIASYFFWLDPLQSLELLHPDLRNEILNSDPVQPLMESLERVAAEPERLNRMLYLEAKHFLADHNLNYTDKMGMAAGVEVRVPLLDTDLISLVTSLPIDLKQHGNCGKWIFKKAMEPYLPNDVIYRPKTGFGAPLRSWLHGELSSTVDRLLADDVLRARGIFDPKAIRRLLEDDRAGRVDASYPIFGLICTEIWCQLFIDNAGEPPAKMHQFD